MYQDQQRTTPYGPQAARVSHHIFRHGSPRLVIVALIAGLLGIAVSAASLTFMLNYRTTATAEIHQLQEAVSNAQASSQANASSLNGLSGKVSTIGAGMAAVAQFNQVCSQALVTQTGTGQFYFMCTDQKPPGG